MDLSTRPKENLVNLFHIVFVGPLLIALATDKFPQQYKTYLLYLAILMIVYHIFRLYKQNA